MAPAGPCEPLELDITLREMRADVERVQTRVADALRERCYDNDSMFAVRLCLEEALVNAFRHGNRFEPGLVVKFQASIGPETCTFQVEDQGEGFDPGGVPDPTSDENLEIPSGRGIMLMRAYMSEVEYLDPGNRIRMVFKKPASGSD
ncbi:MAG: ATP-binding protein [Planctomycetes bacterium]|nr:ATP-binding protein [Planctomycetota bacterium]